MPCTDGGVPYPPTREEALRAKMPAALCAILKAVDAVYGESDMWRYSMFEAADWEEAGVSLAELREWWGLHQKADEERRKQEKENEDRALQRIIGRLSPDEQRILFKHLKGEWNVE